MVTDIFYFSPQKQSTQCTSQPTQSCTYDNIQSTYKTTEEFTVHSYSKKKKNEKKNCSMLSSVSVWPQHLIYITSQVFPGHAAGEISSSIVNPAMKSTNCYISTCVFHSLEKGYAHLWISIIYFLSVPALSNSVP